MVQRFLARKMVLHGQVDHTFRGAFTPWRRIPRRKPDRLLSAERKSRAILPLRGVCSKHQENKQRDSLKGQYAAQLANHTRELLAISLGPFQRK